jgi:predicted DNA-binding protein (MmcQ/YjbR family)
MSELSAAVQVLRRFALRYPEASEDFPWGERTIKVRGKIFVFLNHDGEQLSLTVKLPHSADAALGLPFTSPTRYRLGRSGWVSVRFPKGSVIPLDMFRDWIDESYCAVAPGSLVRKSPHPALPRRRGRGKTRAKSGLAASP